MLSEAQKKAVEEIVGFYESPETTREIIAEAVRKKSPHFDGDSSTELLLRRERAAYAKRQAAGVKGTENILRNTLDLLRKMEQGGVGSASTGFNYLRWQENGGRRWG